jgi:hypothetical protein
MPSATTMRFRLCEFRFGPDRPSHLRAGEHDIGADNDPKGVLADDRDGDEDANDPNNCHHERGDKSKTHLHPGLLTHCPRAAHIPPVKHHGRCCIRPTRINSKRLCCIDFFTPGAHAMASLIVASFCRSARRTLVDRSLPLWRSGLPDIPVARVSGSGARSAAIPSSAKKIPACGSSRQGQWTTRVLGHNAEQVRPGNCSFGL